MRHPALRTVRAVFPHTALQSVVSSSRLSRSGPGLVKCEQPVLCEVGIGPQPTEAEAFFFAAFDAVHQRRQHPLRPNRSFGPRDHAAGLCTVRSPLGHSRCCLCLGRGLHVSTFLPPFPRPGLCCPCLSRLAPHRSYEGSASWRARTRAPGLSASFALPSEHPAPNHDVGLDIALSVTSAHRARPHAGELLPREAPGFASLRQARRTPRRRNGFVILQAARSPPIAPHLASRRRSYLRLHRP